MSVYETSITNPKKQLEFYKQLSEQLQQENKELYQKYLNAVSDYEQEKFKVEELKKEIVELEESSANAINKQVSRGIDLVNQQQEFIKYLEDERNKWHYNYDNYNYEYEVEEPTAEELLTIILSKYKEIIGGENE